MPSTNSSFTSLPLDLIVDSILVLLPLHDLLSLSCTCRNLHSAIHQTELVWKRKIASDYRFPINSTGRIAGFKTLYRKLRKPQVWVWGQNTNGRLGLKESAPLDCVASNYGTAIPTPLRLHKAEPIGIIDLQAGGWSFHGLDIEGNVWYWGTLDGMSDPWNPSPLREYPKRCELEPAMLTIKHLPKFKAISCGRSHACGISDAGTIYEWHSWARIAKLSSVPWEETLGGRHVTQICAGWDFSALLSSDGVVYFWKEPTAQEFEKALDSQFGNVNRMGTVFELDSRDRIIRCPDLPAVDHNESQTKSNICKIACGEDFIICLTSTGQIFKLDVSSIPVTERASSQRTSRRSEEEEALYFRESIAQAFRQNQRTWEYLPKFCESDELLQGLSDALPPESFSDLVRPKITHISAQYRTFVAYSVENPSHNQLTTKPTSFVFLGKKETTREDKPDIIPDLQQRGVIQVTLGDYHFAALLSNGSILSWGSYSEGALGLGNSTNPHRKLVPLGPSDSSTLDNSSKEDESVPKYEMGIQSPTAVQSFTGTEYRLSDRVTSTGRSSTIQNSAKVSSRYVFSVTAAGWHTGCLAFALDEEEDLDDGLAVLEKEVEYSRGAGSSTESHHGQQDEQEQMPYTNRVNFPNFRIGFPGRFMRGGARGGLLSRLGFIRNRPEESESEESSDDE